MKTTEFNNPVTGTKLAENFEKQFGARVNLAKYDREQLEDIRNKLRTRIFQQEGSAKFNDLLTNETYQKDKAMLELLNTRIKEMLGEQMKQLRDRMDQLTEGKKGAKPDFLDMDKDGNKKEPMKKAVADKKKNPFVKKESVVSEISDKAKLDYANRAQDSARGNRSMADLSREAGDEKGAKKYDAKAKKRDAGHAKVVAPLKKHFGMKEGAKPDFLDMDKDGDKKEPMKKAVKDKKVKEGADHDKGCDCNECMGTFEGKDEGKPGKNFAKIAKKAGKEYGSKAAGERVAGAVRNKLKKQGKLEESQFKHNVRFVNESLAFLINEDEEGKAQAITAASDMVNDFTSWMQRVGQYQTKAMIELADQIRADFGQAESEAFKLSVAPALSTALETLTQQRETISNAVAALASGSAPQEPMGMEPDLSGDIGMDPDLDLAGPDDLNPPVGDEFGASDAAAGGAEVAGRGLRESREQHRARKLSESHSLMAKLAK